MPSNRRWSAIGSLAVLPLFLAACGGAHEGGEHAEGAEEHAVEAPGGEHAEAAGEHAVESPAGEHSEEGGREGEGEHGREGGEGEHGREGGEGEHGEGGHDEGGEEGEEPGTYIGASATWDLVRRGARLVLAYDAAQDAFVGRVENTTDATLCAVRVEVHLGGGPELGPTARTDVPAGGSTDVVLPAEGNSFETWTAHPELSACGG